MGGEKSPHAACRPGWIGSPPRGRGKVFTFCIILHLDGITPAWAGKRLCDTRRFSPSGDHPRVGGEKIYFILRFPSVWGSPPRGRGKELSFVGFEPHTGITPAWAGKSKAEAGENACPEDHPRVGGEKDAWTPTRPNVEGSPPRGRGKGKVGDKVLLLRGITPAWAGKSRKNGRGRKSL